MPTPQEVLEWEITGNVMPAAKPDRVRESLGINMHRYYQLLAEAVWDDRLLELYPQEIYRYRTVMQRRVEERNERLFDRSEQ